MFCKFSVQLNMENADMLFSAFGPETEGTNKLAKNKLRFDL